MTLERWIAVFFLLFSLVYGYAAYTYPLLPFERNMVFLPSTMPIGLAGMGVILSLAILVFSRPRPAPADDGESDEGSDALGNIDIRRWRRYRVGQALGLLAVMAAYALAIFPVGFIASTTLFVIAGAMILGERRLAVLVPVAVVGAVGVWYLVQEVLGVFLRPWPWFLA